MPTPVQPLDNLTGEDLTARIKGDALHLVELVHDVGPEAIDTLIGMWPPSHLKAVAIALAAAVDDTRPISQLWAWLGDRSTRTTRTVQSTTLWKAVRTDVAEMANLGLPSGRHKKRPVDPAKLEAMQERCRAASKRSAEARRSKAA